MSDISDFHALAGEYYAVPAHYIGGPGQEAIPVLVRLFDDGPALRLTMEGWARATTPTRDRSRQPRAPHARTATSTR